MMMIIIFFFSICRKYTHAYFGAGYACAAHGSSTSSPTFATRELLKSVIFGATLIFKSVTIKRPYELNFVSPVNVCFVTQRKFVKPSDICTFLTCSSPVENIL